MHEIIVILKQAWVEIQVIWTEAWADYHPIEEIKTIWDEAKAEVQFERHQKAIDLLARQAQLEIDELKRNPYFH